MRRCSFIFIAVLAALLLRCASSAIGAHVVCDGLLPIQERDTSNNVLVSYTRGLDLFGSLQGAGGIGGLLARTDANGSTFYHADGAGNITAMMDGSENIVARYLYGPFGKPAGQWGTMACVNEMQFSSMPWRDGISFYARRAYLADVGRWLNQDPIQEAGGINLYGFVGNNPVNRVDPLGLFVAANSLDYYASGAASDPGNLQAQAAMGGGMAAGTVTTIGIAFAAPEALPAWGSYLWAAGAGAAGGYVGNGTANTINGQPFNQNAGTATALGAGLALAGRGIAGAISAPRSCPIQAGKGIVNNGKVVEHAPIEAVTSHEQLAIKSGTLLEAPQSGTAGQLVPGAEAFTYSVEGGQVFVYGSPNFNSNVSENTVQVVTMYLRGQK